MNLRNELRPWRPAQMNEPRDLFGDVMRSFFAPAFGGAAEPWSPPAEVAETPQSYIVSLDVPGIDPSEINVTLVGDTLTIQGERKEAGRTEAEQLHWSERRHGGFARTFTFPAPVAPDGVEASSRHGVLTVTVTKAREAQPRKVTVKAR